jgi:IS5 family transposase
VQAEASRSQAETPPIALCRFPGPVPTDGHLGRWYLKGAAGDAANVILSTVGHNLRLVLAWLRFLLRLLLIALARLFAIPVALNPAS